MMNQPERKILIIDDDKGVRDVLVDILKRRFAVFSASDSKSGLALAQSIVPDAVLLDVHLIEGSGTNLCRLLREDQRTQSIPVIMMTGHNEEALRIEAFQSGADDFLHKPFSAAELLARIEAKLRRAGGVHTKSSGHIEFYGYKLDFESRYLSASGYTVSLRETEFKILRALLNKPDSFVTRADLETLIWDGDSPVTRSLDTHVSALRKKLHSTEIEIRTVYGRGYRINFKGRKTG